MASGKRYQPSSPEEEKYLSEYDTSAFPPFAVTTDVVMLTIRDDRLCVLLVQRGEHPYQGRWALPGGFVGVDEDLEAAARRELREETGVTAGTVHFEQLGTYGAAGRDPRMRVVDVAYLALLPQHATPTAGSDADEARWWPVDDIEGDMLAFDHDQILAAGVERARAKLEYTAVATSFLPEHFTLSDLSHVYEVVWGAPIHRANFRRKVIETDGFVVEVDDTADRPTGRRGRPSTKLYRAGRSVTLHPPLLRATSDTP